MTIYSYISQSGNFIFELNNDKLYKLHLPKTSKHVNIPNVNKCKVFEKDVLKINIEALELFLDGEFNLINLEKVMDTWEMIFSPFNQKVYHKVIEIAPGSTLTYRKVAELAGNLNAYRAVGNAMRRNRFPLLIPCHRVIGSDYKLRGYSGADGTLTKSKLIEWEKHTIISSSKFCF